MSTLTVTPYTNGNSSADAINTATWSTLIGSAGNTSNTITTNTTSSYFSISTIGAVTWYSGIRGIFIFDTSALGSSAIISAATLTFTTDGGGSTGGGLSPAPQGNVYLASPASNSVISNADWNNVSTTAMSNSPISFDSWQPTAAFAFNSTGLANISKTGYSRFGAREVNYDVTGTSPATRVAFYCAVAYGGAGAPSLVITYTLPTAPTVTGSAATNVAQTSMTGNGNITADGGATVTTRGFCYMTGTSGDPTTANSTAFDTGSFATGAYTKSITGLTADTNYRVRAYAINSVGTSYGTTTQEKTLANGPTTLSTWGGIAKASIKTMDGVAIASVKTWNGVT